MSILRHTLARALPAMAAALFALAGEPVADDAAGQAAPEALQPIARLAQEKITECSGIVRLDGAWFVHNDSGDAPVLYRCASLDFAQAEMLPLAGAEAIDWEDIAVLEGDLLIGDIGDNRRQRDHLVLYRARYQAPAGAPSGRLELIATYPFRYPEGRHNAEALVVIDGAVHVITKASKKEDTCVYRFDALRDLPQLQPGEMNIPRLLAVLEIGPKEQVTAADFDTAGGTVALLTYDRILGYPREHFAGAPSSRMAIAAGQCEALCFDGDRLIIANEGRQVFAVDLEHLRGAMR